MVEASWIYLFNKYHWIRSYVHVPLNLVDILHIYINWEIFSQLNSRDLKPVAFLVLIVWVMTLSKKNCFLQLKANLWWRWRKLPSKIYESHPIELEFVGKKSYNPFQTFQYFKCSSCSGLCLSQTRTSFELEGVWERLYVLYMIHRWNDLLLEHYRYGFLKSVRVSKIIIWQQK